jgi:hypothetical protein
MQYNQPFDQPTNPNAAYVNGNPSTGTQGSIPPAAAIEYPQRELVNVIQNKGLMTPSNGDLTQLGKAIQNGSLFSGLDASTTPSTVTVTLSPAPDQYTNGMSIFVRMANAPTGASIINCNTLGNKPIVTSGGTPIVRNAWQAGDWVELVYDSITGKFQAQGVIVAGAPIYLTANRDYYVGGVGASDANDGTTASVSGTHGPWATLQKAADFITQFNLNGFNINIHVADGSYAGVKCASMSGSGAVLFLGNVSTPANCQVTGTNQSAFSVNGYSGTYSFDGFQVSSSGTPNNDSVSGFSGSGYVNIAIGNTVFANCSGGHISISQHATAGNKVAGSSWVVNGNCSGNAVNPGCFLYAYGGAIFQSNSAGGPQISFPNSNVTFAGSFVEAHFQSFTQLTYVSLSGAGLGSVIGKKFRSDSNSTISVAGGGVNYYPGNVAGTADSTTYGAYG